MYARPVSACGNPRDTNGCTAVSGVATTASISHSHHADGERSSAIAVSTTTTATMTIGISRPTLHPRRSSLGSSTPRPRKLSISTKLNANSARAAARASSPSTWTNHGPAHKVCIDMKLESTTMATSP